MIRKAAFLSKSASRLTYFKSASYITLEKAKFQLKSQPDLKLLKKQNKNNILQAFKWVVENPATTNFLPENPEQVLPLDQAVTNRDSSTFRIFDRYQKRFLVYTTYDLSSDNGLKNLLLSLRQYHKKTKGFAQSHIYQGDDKIAESIHSIGKVFLGEFLVFRQKNNITWSEAEVKALVWNLLSIINSQKQIGARCLTLELNDIVLSPDGKSLEVVNFRGFDISSKSSNPFFCNWETDLDIILKTLANAFPEGQEVITREQAHTFWKKKPTFYAEFERAKKLLGSPQKRWLKGCFNSLFDFERSNSQRGGGNYLVQQEDLIISNELQNCLPLDVIFSHKKWNKHIQEYVRQTLEKNGVKNLDEIWGDIQCGLGDFYGACVTYQQNYYNKNEGKLENKEEKRAKYYLDMGEAYQYHLPTCAPSYFRDAIDDPEHFQNCDPELKARIYNEFAKTMWVQEKYKEAYEYIKEAEKIIVQAKGNKPKTFSRLYDEIATNYDYIMNNIPITKSEVPKIKHWNLLKWGLWSVMSFAGMIFVGLCILNCYQIMEQNGRFSRWSRFDRQAEEGPMKLTKGTSCFDQISIKASQKIVSEEKSGNNSIGQKEILKENEKEKIVDGLEKEKFKESPTGLDWLFFDSILILSAAGIWIA